MSDLTTKPIEDEATKPARTPLQEGALTALAAAEAAGSMASKLSSDPGVQAGAAIAVVLARIIAAIVEAHGAAGAAEAKALLERLHAEGPQGITDADLAADDAQLLAEIRGWYAAPPPNPYPAAR